MAKYTTESIRAVALVGHGGAGKTTLAEALLFKVGAIAAMGSVEKGSSVCDFDPQEKTAGHSLNSAMVNFAAEGVHTVGPVVIGDVGIVQDAVSAGVNAQVQKQFLGFTVQMTVLTSY